MNHIFFGIILIAFVVGALTGSMAEVGMGALSGAEKAVTIAIGLIGYMALFLGLMKIAEEGGLLNLLAKAIRPIMVFLFPEVPANHPAMGAMIMNIAANMMGLTNAATPLGIKAMQELNKLNRYKGTATNAMCLFLAINTSGVALLPSGVVSMRAVEGSADPWGIMGSTLFATSAATVVGIVVAKSLQMLPFFRIPVAPPGADEGKEAPEGADEPSTEPEEEDEAVRAMVAAGGDSTSSIGVWVLRGFLLLSLGLLAGPPLLAIAIGDTAQVQSESGDSLVPGSIEHPKDHFSAGLFDEQLYEGTWTVEEAPEGADTQAFTDRWRPRVLGQYVLVQDCETANTACPRKTVSVVFVWSSLLRYCSKIIGDWVIPILILSLVLFGLFKGIKVYEAFIRGAKEGFHTGVLIIPYLVAILVAVGMFRASGAETVLTWIGSFTSTLGLPGEVLPMAMVRPLSGSGAYGMMSELIHTHGPDTYIGYLASTMQGSTETTFYVLAVYFGSVGITRARHAALAGLAADLAGFIAAIAVCYFMFGHLI